MRDDLIERLFSLLTSADRAEAIAGDLIQETKTEDTHLRIADDIQLVPGGKYFVSIRAHVRGGKTVKSDIMSFRISER